MPDEPVAFGAAGRFEVADRRVVVTGAAHGLGLAIATAFLGAGASVGLVDIDGSALADVEKEVSSKGTVVARAVDVRDTAAVDDAVADLAAQLGGLDVLVNNAAIFPTATVPDIDVTAFLDALDINVCGYTRFIQAAHPHLLRSGRGRIVNLGSITFFMGYPDRLSQYIASKGAVVGLTRALARELGPSGVTVNVIAPGAFPTRAEDIYEDRDAYNDEVLGHQALKRRGEVGDIACAALFLASDAASFVTGQTLVVDGGWMFD